MSDILESKTIEGPQGNLGPQGNVTIRETQRNIVSLEDILVGNITPEDILFKKEYVTLHGDKKLCKC